MSETDIGAYIGWGGTTTDNDSGDYSLKVIDANEVIVYGLGTEQNGNNQPASLTQIELPSGKIKAWVVDVDASAAGFVVSNLALDNFSSYEPIN
jgi:hypothetical protein